jgi:hypothetical protein
MADMQSVTIPQPPSEANLQELHKWATSFILWMNQNFGSGVQQTFLSQNQVSNINGNENIGKIHYNNDTNTFQGTFMSGGNLVVKTFMAS